MVTALPRPQLAALVALGLATAIRLSGSTSGLAEGSLAPRALPMTVGAWVGTPLPVGPRVVELLETQDVAAMEYRIGDGQPVWLAHVGGVGTRAAFHPPELCYVGSHYEILERRAHSVPINGQTRQVMRLLVGQGSERFEAWYWFTAADRWTPSYHQQQLWLLLDAIRGRPMAGTLVRLSTPLDQPDRARERLLGFLTAMTASATPSTAP